MAKESRAFALSVSLASILLTAGITSLFVLATSDGPSNALWIAAWGLTAAGVLTFLVVGAWPLLWRAVSAARVRLQYRASNGLDPAGNRWLQLDRPSDEAARFRLTIIDPGRGFGRKEFAQAGRRILVEFPGRDFAVGVAPLPGKYRVFWEVFRDQVMRIEPTPKTRSRRVATARDSFRVPKA